MNTIKNTIQPVVIKNRIKSLDFLRGIALLGILLINIEIFSMIGATRINPTAYGDLTGINKITFIITHLIADGKFIALFSMLFGAGIVLFSQKAESVRTKSARIHYRRMFWLLIIGLLHAYLLWHGDILVTYALIGMVVYWLRKKSAKKLLILGLIFFAIGSIPYLLIGLSLPDWPQQIKNMLMQFWKPSTEIVASEIATYKGGWFQQLEMRIGSAIFMQTNILLMYVGWQVTGLMLIGMSLFKRGILSVQKSNSFYIKMLLIGMVAGLAITSIGMINNFNAAWSLEYSMFLGWQFNYWGSLFLSLGYIAIIMLTFKEFQYSFIVKAISAVGRTAFSNYLFHSIICTFIFYGHGLGLFGDVERYMQIIIVVLIWITQTYLSTVWLKHHSFGPLEWLWRYLTYKSKLI